jgi:hypothetical protein
MTVQTTSDLQNHYFNFFFLETLWYVSGWPAAQGAKIDDARSKLARMTTCAFPAVGCTGWETRVAFAADLLVAAAMINDQHDDKWTI